MNLPWTNGFSEDLKKAIRRKAMEAWEIPNVDFKMRENGEWRTRNSDEFLMKKPFFVMVVS